MLRQVFAAVAGSDDATARVQKNLKLLLAEIPVHQCLVGRFVAVGHYDYIIMAQPAFVDFMEGEDIDIEGGFIIEGQHFMGGTRPDTGMRKEAYTQRTADFARIDGNG